MDDPNITMEEYMRLEEEKACKHGKVYNWETAMYGKIWYDEDVHDLRYVEAELPAIVFSDTLTSEVMLSCEHTVGPLNDNQIYFRISFDESNDEDYTVIYDKNSFSYKIIYVNDLKTDSENDYDKVNMPSFPLPKPTVSYFNDIGYFKVFEKEFSAIVYNDALTSKSDFLTEPTVNMDDPNITMEEYIRLEEEKARRRVKVSVETEFPAIVFNDKLRFEEALSCEPTVSPLNDNKIDFRISFDESDDEDYTLFNDLDFLKDFENEYPAIIFNDASTSKSDSLTEPVVIPQRIDEFNLKDETSLSEYDEEEQNIYTLMIYFLLTYQYGVSWGMDTVYRLPVQF
ncbi:hypothetical protein Tco_0269670 [Tanacetum coccineum]